MRQLVPELAEFYIRLDEFCANALRPRPFIRKDGCDSFYSVSSTLYDEYYNAIQTAKGYLERNGVWPFLVIEEKEEGDAQDRLIVYFTDPSDLITPFETIEVVCK